jgi:hypoxanthine phosphoribosyltransferase
VLIPEAVIRERVRALGEEITERYLAEGADRELVVMGVLKGAFMFVADLVREIDLPMIVDFVGASSYGDGRSSCGEVHLNPGSWVEVKGRDVLVVEDVLDTGNTLKAVVAALESHGARSVRTVALLRKPGAKVAPDFVGFEIDGRWVIGYGLDDAGKWRHLPYVGHVDGIGA